MTRRLSLRTRLILGVIALAAAGLVTADVVTYTSLRSFLISRTDSTLQAAHVSVESALGQNGPPPDGGHDGESRRGPGGGHGTLSDVALDIGRLTRAAPGVYVQVRRPNGA